MVGQGILHVKVPDFLEQLTTFPVRNSSGPGTDARWLGRFGQFFFGELWETYIRFQVPGAIRG